MGNIPLSGVTLTDSLTLPGSCVVPATLALGDSFSCTYSRVAPAGTTSNTATADSAQTAPATASATVIATTPTAPALNITKGVSLNQAGPFLTSLTTTPGTTVWYQIVVTNTGNSALSGIAITDSLTLPASCPVVPATLAIGATYSCVYSRVAAQGTTVNTATADSTDTTPVTSSATVVSNPPAAPPVTAPSASPTGSVAPTSSPATPTPAGSVLGATSRPNITLPPTDTLRGSGQTTSEMPVALAGLALIAAVASLMVILRSRPRRLRR